MASNNTRYLLDPDTVSLDQIKYSTMGRSISSIYDYCPTNLQSPEPSTKHSPLPKITEDSLRQELLCIICRELLYNPVSLFCGHSFCQVCLNFWLEKDESCPSCRGTIVKGPPIRTNTALKAVLDHLYSTEMSRRRMAEQEQESKLRGGEMGGMHTQGSGIEVVSLPAEDEVRFLQERVILATRTRATMTSATRATTEQESYCSFTANDRSPDAEHGWVPLVSFGSGPAERSGGAGHNYSHGAGATIMIRRNIVLDETDQRYQMSLGLNKCTYSISKQGTFLGKTNYCPYAEAVDSRGVLDIELCLLTMEEDEVQDSGFPLFLIEGSDDDVLICTTASTLHSHIQSSARVASKEQEILVVNEVPLSKGKFGTNGRVQFHIDTAKVLGCVATTMAKECTHVEGIISPPNVVVKLRFVHVNTGAVLELRLPPRSESDTVLGGGDGVMVFGTSRKDHSTCDVMDNTDDEEAGNENGYVEDGFLVFSTSESDSSDEVGVCEICNEVGDMIVCNGGIHHRGCDKLFHMHCIGLHLLPQGKFSKNLMTLN